MESLLQKPGSHALKGLHTYLTEHKEKRIWKNVSKYFERIEQRINEVLWQDGSVTDVGKTFKEMEAELKKIGLMSHLKPIYHEYKKSLMNGTYLRDTYGTSPTPENPRKRRSKETSDVYSPIPKDKKEIPKGLKLKTDTERDILEENKRLKAEIAELNERLGILEKEKENLPRPENLKGIREKAKKKQADDTAKYISDIKENLSPLYETSIAIELWMKTTKDNIEEKSATGKGKTAKSKKDEKESQKSSDVHVDEMISVIDKTVKDSEEYIKSLLKEREEFKRMHADDQEKIANIYHKIEKIVQDTKPKPTKQNKKGTETPVLEKPLDTETLTNIANLEEYIVRIRQQEQLFANKVDDMHIVCREITASIQLGEEKKEEARTSGDDYQQKSIALYEDMKNLPNLFKNLQTRHKKYTDMIGAIKKEIEKANTVSTDICNFIEKNVDENSCGGRDDVAEREEVLEENVAIISRMQVNLSTIVMPCVKHLCEELWEIRILLGMPKGDKTKLDATFFDDIKKEINLRIRKYKEMATREMDVMKSVEKLVDWNTKFKDIMPDTTKSTNKHKSKDRADSDTVDMVAILNETETWLPLIYSQLNDQRTMQQEQSPKKMQQNPNEEHEVQKMREKLQGHKESIKALMDELETKEGSVQHSQKRISELEKEKEGLRGRYKESLKALKEELETKEGVVQFSQKRIGDLEKEKDVLLGRLSKTAGDQLTSGNQI